MKKTNPEEQKGSTLRCLARSPWSNRSKLLKGGRLTAELLEGSTLRTLLSEFKINSAPSTEKKKKQFLRFWEKALANELIAIGSKAWSKTSRSSIFRAKTQLNKTRLWQEVQKHSAVVFSLQCCAWKKNHKPQVWAYSRIVHLYHV